ncbi:hypothetical protein CYMTET_8687 [Cymbomonas tetramitiformis]|uniref:Uncharacterized protein n=1 Tax=Cymbomonas tetramitiformis TaxID=36881 RepID=A0AAE0GSG5_9CHLO|nr:hypothetical protein CYMTET_8687 [Cymbomonas tetramitiformis]
MSTLVVSRHSPALFLNCFSTGMMVSRSRVLEIVRKTWRLEQPNLLISLEAGSAHPCALGTKKLLKLPQFRHWKNQAKAQREQKRGRTRRTSLSGSGQEVENDESQEAQTAAAAAKPAASEIGGAMRNAEKLLGRIGAGLRITPHVPPAEVENDESQEAQTAAAAASEESRSEEHDETDNTVNSLLFHKLITVFCAVLDSAAQTNNWIVVDRTRAHSPTAELLLELALLQSRAKPKILVITSLERFQKMAEYQEKWHPQLTSAAKQVQQMEAIIDECKQIGTIDTNKITPQSLDRLYTADDFKDWSNKKFIDEPIPSEPLPKHCPNGEQVSEKRRWMYHYTQYIFHPGTHYIITEKEEQEFPFEFMAPFGKIFAHGGSAAYSRMYQWLSRGKPSVLLFNSGGVTQAFGSLHNDVIKRHKHDSVDIMKSLQIVSSEDWTNQFGVADIMMFHELKQRAPLLMRKSIVVVDVVTDSAEEVLEAITSCFSQVAAGIPELGLGSAETDVVYEAWRQHLCLYANAKRQRHIANRLYILATVLTILTALTSALYTSVEVGRIYYPDNNLKDDVKDVTLSVFDYVLISLPLLAALLTTIMSRLQTLDKWATLHMAASEIVVEIYQFRTRVGIYDDSYTAHHNDEKLLTSEDKEDLQEPQSGQQPRMNFVTRVQKIFSTML